MGFALASNYECIGKPYISEIQKDLDELQDWTTNNNKKTKELRISFLNGSPCFEQLKANNDQVKLYPSFNFWASSLPGTLDKCF